MAEPPAQPLQSDWQSRPPALWAAILLGALPFYLLAIASGLQQEATVADALQDGWMLLAQSLLEVLIFGGSIVAAMWWLNGQRPHELNLRADKAGRDLLSGLLLFFALLGVSMLFALTASLLGIDAIPPSNLEIARELSANPLSFAVFIGPVVWLRAALLEELSRCFILSRLWRLFPHPAARQPCILSAAALFGIAHLWQGWLAVAVTFGIGYLLGSSYSSRGRFWPLVLGHGLYNTMVSLVLYGIGMGAIAPPAP